MALLRPLCIGSVRLENNLVLSPMAGFTDLPFRVLARRYGAGLVSSEMVHAGGLAHGDERTLLRTRVTERERPVCIQVAGTEPDEVADAATRVAPAADLLGFNMGCPAWQVRRQGCGAALLDHPERSAALVAALKEASDLPLVVKLRAGNQAPTDLVTLTGLLEDAGADAFIVHARTAREAYTGVADWSRITALLDHVGVPLIGNGDVTDGPSAERALASGVDGVAIGRASLGDAHVFSRIAHYLETGQEPPHQGSLERLSDALAYLELAEELGTDRGQRLRQVQQFTKGLRGGRALRARLQDEDLAPARVSAAFHTLVGAHVEGTA